jgi:hypothetical protein
MFVTNGDSPALAEAVAVMRRYPKLLDMLGKGDAANDEVYERFKAARPVQWWLGRKKSRYLDEDGSLRELLELAEEYLANGQEQAIRALWAGYVHSGQLTGLRPADHDLLEGVFRLALTDGQRVRGAYRFLVVLVKHQYGRTVTPREAGRMLERCQAHGLIKVKKGKGWSQGGTVSTRVILPIEGIEAPADYTCTSPYCMPKGLVHVGQGCSLEVLSENTWRELAYFRQDRQREKRKWLLNPASPAPSITASPAPSSSPERMTLDEMEHAAWLESVLPPEPSDKNGMKNENNPEKVTGRSHAPEVEDKTKVEDQTKVEDKTEDKTKVEREPGNPISPTTGEYIGD